MLSKLGTTSLDEVLMSIIPAQYVMQQSHVLRGNLISLHLYKNNERVVFFNHTSIKRAVNDVSKLMAHLSRFTYNNSYYFILQVVPLSG